MNLTEELRIADIIVASMDRELDDDETKILNLWLDNASGNRVLYQQILSGKHDMFAKQVDDGFHLRKDFEHTLNKSISIETQRCRRRNKRQMYLRYAALLVPAVLLLGLLVWRVWSREEYLIADSSVRNSTSAAILIRGDGSQVEIDPQHLSEKVDYADVLNERDGMIISYKEMDDAAGVYGNIMNTIIVQAGNDFRLELSDGTRVYLDAASELQYPVRFDGDYRRVNVKGRAYFEVKPADRPFIVDTPGSSITVYGTQFCVDDSGNGSVTTLVSGSVKVSSSGGAWELKPGQQVTVSAGEGIVEEVETMYYTAWKDGYFMYNAVPLGNIMDELGRWYGVKFRFEGDRIEYTKITARIKRYDDLEPVLDILAEANNLEYIREKGSIIIRTL